MAPVSSPKLRAPASYLNRELSWLDFNRRVLAQAEDPTHPLLERVKFLAIVIRDADLVIQEDEADDLWILQRAGQRFLEVGHTASWVFPDWRLGPLLQVGALLAARVWPMKTMGGFDAGSVVWLGSVLE